MTTSRERLVQLRQLHPLAIDLSLERMRVLLEKLGNPQRRLPPVVHVAGTNGKGSVLAFMRAMLEAAGRRVHGYTSPPLRRLHDAIRLATGPGRSEEIGEEQLAELLGRVIAANGGAALTSFEGETAAAFLAFASTPADLVLLETGMGGATDATNVIDRPAVAALTPIAMDHADYLGRSLEAIAAVKAGIIKPGCPVVVARQEPSVLSLIRARAKQVGAPLRVMGEDFDCYEQHGRLVYQDEAGGVLMDLPLPALIGRHQLGNAGLAVAAAQLLGRLKPSDHAIEAGLAAVRWEGRLQRLAPGGLTERLERGSEIWLDGGHNSHAALALAEAMAEMEERSSRPLHLVFGMLRSKDPMPFLEAFGDLAAAVIAVPVPDVSRAYARSYDTAELVRAAEAIGLRAIAAPDIREALELSATMEDGPARVLVCGSLHLVGHVLAEEEAELAQRAKRLSRS